MHYRYFFHHVHQQQLDGVQLVELSVDLSLSLSLSFSLSVVVVVEGTTNAGCGCLPAAAACRAGKFLKFLLH